jgi:hypothetical protein
MAYNRKSRKKSKEIWYETTQEKAQRKKRYLPILNKELDEDLTAIIILLIFIIGMILLWIRLQG